MAMKIDSVKFKNQAVSSHFYLVSYYNDIKKDKEAAVSHINRVLAIDPSNADAARIREILIKPARPTQPQSKPKPKTSTSSAKSSNAGAKK